MLLSVPSFARAACALLLSGAALAQIGAPAAAPVSNVSSTVPTQATRGLRLAITVTDENNVPVAHALVTAESIEGGGPIWRGETDSAGRLRLLGMAPGQYKINVAHAGFYPLSTQGIDPSGTSVLELAIHHHQPVGEVVNVTDVAPGIDPQQTSKSETLQSRDIVNIPYPTTRDVRYVLPYIPGVVQEQVGNQVHIAGAAAYQTDYVLDGFRMNQPSTGLFELRVSPDAVRTINVESSRYSAQYGEGSGGVLAMDTRTGDDNYRFSVVNFIPTFQNTHGIALNNWVPRATFGGPLHRGKAWFYLSQDGEVDNVVIKELPKGADRNLMWRLGELGKLQFNVTPGNVLSGSVVYNYLDSPHSFISALTPQSASVNTQRSAWMYNLRDQATLAHSALLELGVGVTQFRDAERPQGLGPYLVNPEGVSGFYYRTAVGNSRRVQGIANLYLPPVQWLGKHDLRAGAELGGIQYRQSYDRGPTLVYDEAGVLIRRISFVGAPPFSKRNTQGGIYAQDRWTPAERVVVEGGIRADRDTIVPHVAVSPRLAGSYTLSRSRQTKVNAGIGVFHDETRLNFITRPLEGQRLDQFYAANGVTPLGDPSATQFFVNSQSLLVPRFLNWSLGLEQMLPGSIYARFEYLDRHGVQGFTFVNQLPNPAAPGGNFLLTNLRADHYKGFIVTGRREFKNGHAVLASYQRSRARTNRALEFNLDNPIFGAQSPGPLPWDAPNRVISWGWLPMPWFKNTDFAYSADWRTGFPFNVVNQQQALAGAPGHMRFPDYLTINPAVEHIFQFLGYQFAIRGGIDNITGRKNPAVVNNNIDSPQFLTFSGTGHRTFNGRIRFLGKK